MNRSKNFSKFSVFAAERLRIWLISGSRRTEDRREKGEGKVREFGLTFCGFGGILSVEKWVFQGDSMAERPFEKYLSEINKAYLRGDARQHAHGPALKGPLRRWRFYQCRY